MTALADQCGIAIENARIFKEQQIQLSFFKANHEIAKMINSTNDLEKILDLIVERLPAVINHKAATIRLIEEGENKLELKSILRWLLPNRSAQRFAAIGEGLQRIRAGKILTNALNLI